MHYDEGNYGLGEGASRMALGVLRIVCVCVSKDAAATSSSFTQTWGLPPSPGKLGTWEVLRTDNTNE